MGTKTMKARDIWFKMLDSQIETGTPYMLYKDACNKKSNQQNLGTIKSSNLCCEIVEYSSSTETSVCNLASLGLSSFVKSDGTFDYDELHRMTKIVTENLNKVIDINFYPTEKTRHSNYLHRPIGIGVQGLADVFAKMDIPYYSEQAKEVNRNIFETIYHAALEKSCEVARDRKEAMCFFLECENFVDWIFITGIFIKHIWCARFDLTIQHFKPYIARIHSLCAHIFSLV